MDHQVKDQCLSQHNHLILNNNKPLIIRFHFISASNRNNSIDSIFGNESDISPLKPNESQNISFKKTNQKKPTRTFFYENQRSLSDYKFSTLNQYQKFQKMMLDTRRQVEPKMKINLTSKLSRQKIKNSSRGKKQFLHLCSAKSIHLYKVGNQTPNKQLSLQQTNRLSSLNNTKTPDRLLRTSSRKGLSLSSTISKKYRQSPDSPKFKLKRTCRRMVIYLTPKKRSPPKKRKADEQSVDKKKKIRIIKNKKMGQKI